MSLERVLDTLVGFGIKRTEAQVYIYLAKKGPRKGRGLSHALKLPKQQVYHSLKNLQNKGIVRATYGRPAKFSAVPFEEVIDLLIKAKKEEAQRTRQDKAEALSDWQALLKENHTNQQTKAQKTPKTSNTHSSNSTT